MEETTFTNNAAEAAEGGTYGEAALVLTERSDEVEKIAVWLPVTDEQLEDEEGAAAYIDQRLGLMIRQRLDSQVILGNGTTPNLKGTNAVSGIQTQALGADSIPDAVYKLFTSIESDGFANPSVLFIRPAHWQTVRLLKTADGQYIWGHPSMAGPEQIWGVPVVKTTVLTSTEAFAGDYTNYSNLYVKRGVDVQITNSHASDFINGKQAIRADLRVAMVHYRPKAFGEITGLAA
jgi:HK97 family phage major capsid protein